MIVKKACQQYRGQQTTHGGKITGQDKQNLRNRLQKPDDELDRYLASEYGISESGYKTRKGYQAAFAKWKESHQPFHWLVEFYGVMIWLPHWWT